MIGVSGGFEIGGVDVHTTQNRGFSPDEIAERCLDKIISVADTALPEVQIILPESIDSVTKCQVPPTSFSSFNKL